MHAHDEQSTTIIGTECEPFQGWDSDIHMSGMHVCISMRPGVYLGYAKEERTWMICLDAEATSNVRFCAWCGIRLPFPEEE